MKKVKVCAVTFRTWADLTKPEAARPVVLRELEDTLNGLCGYGLQLVVLSETVGFYIQGNREPESDKNPGPLLELYRRFARSQNCHVAGSIMWGEEGRIYNSLVFLDGRGDTLGVYRKNFLTYSSPQTELAIGFTPGSSPVVVESEIGRLAGVICFDLNFPELRERYKPLAPDIVCFASMYHGGLMQRMWAYDLRSFFISALPVPNEPCGIWDPLGSPVALSSSYVPNPMAEINLDRVVMHLDRNNDRFPELLHTYGDDVTLSIPPSLGPAILYSNREDRTAAAIAAEFGFTLLDDMYAEARAANQAKRV